MTIICISWGSTIIGMLTFLGIIWYIWTIVQVRQREPLTGFNHELFQPLRMSYSKLKEHFIDEFVTRIELIMILISSLFWINYVDNVLTLWVS